MIPTTFQRIRDLDCLTLQTPHHKRAIVFLHGYGANFADLSSLAPALDPNSSWDWYFPNGPDEVALMPGYVGRTWFPIDMQRLQLALMRGERQPFRREIPLGFSAASVKLDLMMRELSERYDQIVVGGFSQGSMVSCDYALHTEQKVAALLLLSSNIIAESRWEEGILRKQPPAFPVFQSHGQFDPTLPYEGALALKSFWAGHDYQNEFISFPGGHEIPYAVIDALKNFLNNLK